MQSPANIEETLSHWAQYKGPSIGFFLCGQPILSEDDFIAGTSVHSCAEGWQLYRQYAN
jgi:hypothetical protein